MPDTIQVVEVSGAVPSELRVQDSKAYYDLGSGPVVLYLGHVIELTEERRRPFIDDGETMGPGEPRRRWVSEWEATDA